VVDDESPVRSVLKEIPEDCGFYVITAESADVAVGSLQKLVHIVAFSQDARTASRATCL
jgi:CheY-like chemotaxis protein